MTRHMFSYGRVPVRPMRSVLAVILTGLIAGTLLFAYEQYLVTALVLLAMVLVAMLLALRS
jgi:hypothetical protein